MADNITAGINNPALSKLKANMDNRIVIGKIPGYNTNIQKTTSKGDNNIVAYNTKLLHNLTRVYLTPTGYRVNFGILNNFITAAGSDMTATSVADGVNALNNLDINHATYQITQGEGTSFGGLLNTKSALEIWKNMVDSLLNIDSDFKDILKQYSGVNILDILCTNDSTNTEVFTNNFDTNSLDKLTASIASNKFAQMAQQILRVGNTLSSGFGEKVLDTTNSGNSMANFLLAKGLGIKTALPEEWVNSNYQNSLNLMIKLVSPAGDTTSIMNYIIMPLLFLITAASPLTYNGISYGYPMLWSVKAEGLMDMQLAGISALTITRGGAETQFNKDNIPLNVDVRLTLEPLIKSYVTPATVGKDATAVYQNSIASTPQTVIKSIMLQS